MMHVKAVHLTLQEPCGIDRVHHKTFAEGYIALTVIYLHILRLTSNQNGVTLAINQSTPVIQTAFNKRIRQIQKVQI